MALSAGADQNQTTSRILNKLQYAVTDIAADITTAATGDIVLMTGFGGGLSWGSCVMEWTLPQKETR